MRRHLQLLGAYFGQYFKMRVAYRGDFFIGLVTSILATIFGFLVVVVLFRNIPQLAGWKFEEVTFLYGFGLIPFGLFNILSLNIYEFGNTYIIEGKFDRVLLRPISSLFQVLFEAFRIESLQEVVVGTAGVVWAAGRLGLHWTPAGLAMFVFFALCGAVIYVSVFMLLSCVSFWFEDRVGLHPPVWNLIAFGRYPLSIYSQLIQFVLSWIIPFAFASFYPSARLLGRPQMSNLVLVAPLVAAACFTLLVFAWSRGLRQYSSTGS